MDGTDPDPMRLVPMRIDLVKTVETVRNSYWFVPSLMALAAVLLGATMVWLDSGPGSTWLDGIGWYQSVKAEGAHEVLSTIAGSMITVAGVVFSITMVAISYSSSQYGPRVLTNFMTDNGNKVTLGTFIATFLYCLVVLRTIRAGDSAFVPQMAVMVGILLAVCSIGVLIYFIHHVAQAIHVNNVVAHIGRQLIDAVERRFPEMIGEAPRPPAGRADAAAVLERYSSSESRACAITNDATGYIESVDDGRLMEAACRAEILLRLRYRPGDFVVAGRTMIEAWPAERVDEGIEADLIRAYSIGSRRTPLGDLDFLVNELVEIAARALSSGINDPTTAATCVDWLGAGATEIARRHVPSPFRVDADGELRVVAHSEGFGEYLERSFGQLRQYLAGDANAALHALRALGELAAGCVDQGQVDAIAAEGDRLAASARVALDGPQQDAVAASADALRLLLAAGPGAIDSREADWLRRAV